MNVRIESDFRFSVAAIQYTPQGELCITLSSGDSASATRYQYTANLGNWQAEEKPTVCLLQYARNFAASANIKDKTKDSYRLMCNHLEAYGDCPIDKVTTTYIQEFITHLQHQGMKPGSVRLYFQKLACVLHDAYKNGLFDDRILQRVKRPKREQEKKSFLTESELKKLTSHRLSDEYNNIQSMFLFSCMTGLRYSDVQGLRWKDVKRSGKHLQLEFHLQGSRLSAEPTAYHKVPSLLIKLAGRDHRSGSKVVGRADGIPQGSKLSAEPTAYHKVPSLLIKLAGRDHRSGSKVVGRADGIPQGLTANFANLANGREPVNY